VLIFLHAGFVWVRPNIPMRGQYRAIQSDDS
jgi:hypothetical protein